MSLKIPGILRTPAGYLADGKVFQTNREARAHLTRKKYEEQLAEVEQANAVAIASQQAQAAYANGLAAGQNALTAASMQDVANRMGLSPEEIARYQSMTRGMYQQHDLVNKMYDNAALANNNVYPTRLAKLCEELLLQTGALEKRVNELEASNAKLSAENKEMRRELTAERQVSIARAYRAKLDGK